MSAVSAPADRRFRRAHVKPSRKPRLVTSVVKTAARYVVVGLVIVFGLYRVGEVAVHARMLQVDRIVVTGNDRLSKGEVLALLNGLRGQNLVWTDLDLWRQRLLSSPWVRDASLRRSLPSTIDVAITERRPVGIGRLRGEMYLIDERGGVIDQYGPEYADLDLPIVDGIQALDGDSESMADVPRADLAARVIAAVAAKPEIARRVSQVDVSDVHNAAVILSGDPAVLYLGDDRFLPRLESYLGLASALRERVADIDYVDMRFEDRIYVKPAGGKAAQRRPNAVAAAGGGEPRSKATKGRRR